MDRLHEMQVFVAVAEAGSFAKAGQHLRISPPAVTRAVASLENRLGARLFNRSTRSLSLTESGRRFLAKARRILGEIDVAEKEVVGETAAPQGHLTITASTSIGRLALPSILSAFLKTYPEVTASVVLLDRIVNLIDEGIDVGIRVGDLPDSSLMARRVGSVRRVLVASPSYLKEHSHPDRPRALRSHDFIGFTGLMPNREWRFLDHGESGQIALPPRLEVNDAAAAIAAAERGDGITVTLCYMVGERIRQGTLAPVLQPFWPDPVPVHLIYAENRLLASKTRAFIDFAARRLGNLLADLSRRDTTMT